MAEEMAPQRDIITRRLFRNSNGDWKKLEKLTKEINALAEEMDQMAIDLVKSDSKLKDLMLEAYQIAPETDCLFYDSPVAPNRQTLYLKMHLKKIGWDGVRDVSVSSISIEPFSRMIKDGCRWLLKFKNDKTV